MSSHHTRDRILAAAAVVLLAAVPRASAEVVDAAALDRFATRSLDRMQDARDSLATRFDVAQLPYLVAAVAQDDSLDPERRRRAYRAFVRWHFWTGRRWSDAQAGAWRLDPAMAARGIGRPGRTLAAHAASELVQLTALARLAARDDDVADAVLWWSDRAGLKSRLENRLFDGTSSTHVDLDSTGRRWPRPRVSSAIALAAGLDVVPEAARATHRTLWTGSPDRAEGGPRTGESLVALEVADALGDGHGEPGFRLLEPELTAALVQAGLETLADDEIAAIAREALTAAGLAPRSYAVLRVGAWRPVVEVGDLGPEPFERARVAVHLLDRMGVLDGPTSRSLPARVDSLQRAATPESRARLATELSALLASLRGIDSYDERIVWSERRASRTSLVHEHAAFHWRESDLRLWLDRARDRITEDVVAHHRRVRPLSRWRARLQPEVVGRGDGAELDVVVPEYARADTTLVASGLWTDGDRVTGAGTLHFEPTPTGFRAEVETSPDRNGLWTLVVEGLPEALRVPPAVAVVDPLRLDVRAAGRRGRTMIYRVDVESQVSRAQDVSVRVEVPLGFGVKHLAQWPIDLEAGARDSLLIEVSPNQDMGPGLHPVRFELFDASGLVTSVDRQAQVPFEWLHLGALRPRGDEPMESRYGPETQVDLAARFTGTKGAVGWARMARARVDAQGWMDLGEPDGVHFAHTAFTTGSRESILRLESAGAAEVYVNGRRVVATPAHGGAREVEILCAPGTNTVLIKAHGAAVDHLRLDVRDIDGAPLRGVVNVLETLLDQYAYLTRGDETAREEDRTLGRASMRLVPFTFEAPGVTQVSVVGSFNGWSPTATKMVQRADGTWSVKVRMRPGRHEYKIALDGGRWIADPGNPVAVDDGFGGRSSVLVID